MTPVDVLPPCPGCGKGLAANAVVCIQCGFDKRKGKRLTTVKLVRRALCLPRVSGLLSFLVFVACIGITVLVVPMAFRLPVWIEAEIVVGVCWAIWCLALSLFLYKGWLVTHDFEHSKLSSLTSFESGRNNYTRGWWDVFYWGSVPDFGGDHSVGGCLGAIVLIIVLPFLILFLAEAALFLAFVLYLMIRGMLAMVANSRRHCRARLARSLGLGVLWATLYTVPLAGLVWFVHKMHG